MAAMAVRLLARVLPIALLAGATACDRSGDAPPVPAGPSVLLITVDTLRADRLGSYGYERATSPQIDALAARGVRFADCTVQWPKTWPSMASMLTGAHPTTIGVTYLSRTMQPSLLSLTSTHVAPFSLSKSFLENGAG